ncbi:hypothetical protein AKJ65_03530 [candidate division MSBL1 archaeon SCGC-AAA259E19]|uniref:Uncharacterized protein n=1 Tax=candidate division MSBL1 archaeon SCGC-AAA259E19 TaxID=1698264 RepID=A0A133UKM9_9EURY|nr:hypothetical protein AKJ65_03530 [candidate division MSBL1 archaeon SCGC-AAA259E19]
MVKVVECEKCGKRITKPPRHAIERHGGVYCQDCREDMASVDLEKVFRRICEECGEPTIPIEEAPEYYYKFEGEKRKEIKGAYLSYKHDLPVPGEGKEKTRTFLRILAENWGEEEAMDKVLDRMGSP